MAQINFPARSVTPGDSLAAFIATLWRVPKKPVVPVERQTLSTGIPAIRHNGKQRYEVFNYTGGKRAYLGSRHSLYEAVLLLCSARRCKPLDINGVDDSRWEKIREEYKALYD